MATADPSPAVAEAADALYGAPLSAFVAERKRRSQELRDAGDRAGAATVAKLARPSMSAWVVNQLHREAGDDMAALFSSAARMRAGDLAAADAHRAALARLRARAAEILTSDGHAAIDTTLRRVTTTLQALAATGSFDPDPAGRLVADRDPPGFEAFAGFTPREDDEEAGDADADDADADADADDSRAPAPRAGRSAAETAAVAAARDRAREARQAAADLQRLQRAAARARAELDDRIREVAALREQLRKAEDALTAAGDRAAEADAEVASAQARVSGSSPA